MLKKNLKEIAGFVDGELIGEESVQISGIRDIEEAKEGDISFILHKKFSSYLDTTNASCVIVPEDIKKARCPIIKCKSPTIAFIKLAEFLLPDMIPHPKNIHKTALIDKNASIGKEVAIGANSFIADGVSIGDKTIIYPFCYIGDKTKIGNNCIIYPNVTIRENIKIGSRVIIHPGSVIGSDGFGYDNSTGRHLKIPHIGDVIIEDDVEIGACATIDRAKFAHTKIGKGTKIDNLVQIAHNVVIGENCIIASQSGISGSSSLGRNVILGGQVGLADHVKLGDNVMVGAQSGIPKSIPSNSIVLGTPAKPIKLQRRIWASKTRLPELYERIRKIEKALNIKND